MSTWILKGIICCLVSGAGLIVSAVVTLTCWRHSAEWSYGPMLQFPAPPLRCHSNGCLCAEMSRNGTKPDNFQWHTDTERYIAAHCQAAASKLEKSQKIISATLDIPSLTDFVKNNSHP